MNITANRSYRAAGTYSSPAEQPKPVLSPYNLGLFIITILAWSVSWYGLRLQLGVVAVEWSLAYRFALAATIMMLLSLFMRLGFRFYWKDHLFFALIGSLLFSTNFIFFYHAGEYLVGGLLAVNFSLAAVFIPILGALFGGERFRWPLFIYAILGVIGIGLIFSEQIQMDFLSSNTVKGLGLCAAGTLCFSCGSTLLAIRQRRPGHKLPIITVTMYGMIYGMILSVIYALLLGREFNFDPSTEYVASLIFLAIISSVIAFLSYLSLILRIGASRAGYVTIIVPVVALLISTLFESYQWALLPLLGLALVLLANFFALRSR